MTRKLYSIVILLALLLTSCEVDISSNGKLDGTWQLKEITVNGGDTQDVRNEGILWGFQFKLLEMHSINNQWGVLCRFEHNGSSLRIYSPLAQKHDVADDPITDASELNPFGVYAIDETFHIEELTSSRMVLASPNSRLVLRKY